MVHKEEHQVLPLSDLSKPACANACLADVASRAPSNDKNRESANGGAWEHTFQIASSLVLLLLTAHEP